MAAEKKKPSRSVKQLQLHLPADLDLIYANFALITHSHSELVIDFAQVMPQVRRAQVKSRVVMSPLNAKLLLRALQGNIERYETKHGELKIPEGHRLADELFKPFTGDQLNQEEDDG